MFVAGTKTHVGKTTICLGILGHLLRRKDVRASDVAYIKPATQCEKPDLLHDWCKRMGVTYVGGSDAPLLFRKGFTRSYLDGKEKSASHWRAMIRRRVDALCVGRKFVLIDGVGFPAVGSVVGCDNADVARASRAPVVIVGISGVGSAIDSFSLNASYFESRGVRVLGGVFNFGSPVETSYYRHDRCKTYISKWFERTWQARRGPDDRVLDPQRSSGCFGVVPTVSSLEGLRKRVDETSREDLASRARENVDHVSRYVDIDEMVRAALVYSATG